MSAGLKKFLTMRSLVLDSKSKRIIRKWLLKILTKSKTDKSSSNFYRLLPSPARAGGGEKWLMYGLGGAAMVNWIGGMAQGWPMISMMRFGDDLMMLSFMGIALTLVLVIGGIIMFAMKPEDDSLLPPDGAEEMIAAELDDRDERRRRRRRDRRRSTAPAPVFYVQV
eukprot:Blabericola_migrator_1__8632@NODE_4524_length_1106_cov_204_887392_g2802_i0_p1_GENE_NODE_4524_length_1106_cov_204_887392_g2802_i0NODE_4524_length_1106_cov_204_887392_g2802_i0_p1_ORF_typecomplete_len167_score23_09_NODE_4524_length_1106_cov_204_887392_g2802_i047547